MRNVEIQKVCVATVKDVLFVCVLGVKLTDIVLSLKVIISSKEAIKSGYQQA